MLELMPFYTLSRETNKHFVPWCILIYYCMLVSKSNNTIHYEILEYHIRELGKINTH